MSKVAVTRPSASAKRAAYSAVTACSIRRDKKPRTPSNENIGFAQRAQIGEQARDIAIAHDRALDIGDGKRKSRPLQKPAELAHIAERRDARTYAAGDFRFRSSEGELQLLQSLAAKQACDKDTVRLEHAADLHQRARKIVDRMQRQNAGHDIEAAFLEGQHFFVGDHGRAVPRKAGSHPGIREGLQGRKHGRAGMQIEAARKVPVDRAKPLRQMARDVLSKKMSPSSLAARVRRRRYAWRSKMRGGPELILG